MKLLCIDEKTVDNPILWEKILDILSQIKGQENIKVGIVSTRCLRIDLRYNGKQEPQLGKHKNVDLMDFLKHHPFDFIVTAYCLYIFKNAQWMKLHDEGSVDYLSTINQMKSYKKFEEVKKLYNKNKLDNKAVKKFEKKYDIANLIEIEKVAFLKYISPSEQLKKMVTFLGGGSDEVMTIDVAFDLRNMKKIYHFLGLPGVNEFKFQFEKKTGNFSDFQSEIREGQMHLVRGDSIQFEHKPATQLLFNLLDQPPNGELEIISRIQVPRVEETLVPEEESVSEKESGYEEAFSCCCIRLFSNCLSTLQSSFSSLSIHESEVDKPQAKKLKFD